MADQPSRRAFLATLGFGLTSVALSACAGTVATPATTAVAGRATTSTVATKATSAPTTTPAAPPIMSSTTAVVSTAVSSATTSTPATAARAETPAGKAVTLEITSWLTLQPDQDAYSRLFAAYKQVQPDVRLRQVTMPNAQYFTHTTALLAGGSTPDLLETNPGFSQSLGVKGAVQPLDPLIEQAKISLDQYVQTALELGRWPQKTGKYYAWYTMFSTSPLYYNTTLFQEAGQPAPDETWTWQHALDVAQKLTKAGTTPDDAVYGLNLTNYAEAMLFAYGWTYTNADYSQCALESDANAQGMQFWRDLIYKHKVSPEPSSSFGKGAPYGVFSTTRLAMETQGSFQIGSYRTVKALNWDVALPPLGPAGRHAMIKGAPAHSLPAQSPHSDQAWAFLEWWIKNQTPDQVVLPGNLPTRLTALNGWGAQQKQQYPTPAHIDLIQEIATKYGRSYQVLPNDDQAQAALNKEMAAIVANQEDVKTGLTRACQTMMAAINKGIG